MASQPTSLYLENREENMIELSVWLENVIGTCDLIHKNNLLEKVWLDKSADITSITEPDELFEQIFHDLDADNFEHSPEFVNNCEKSLKESIIKFLESLRVFEKLVDDDLDLIKLKILLAKEEWHNVKIAAEYVVTTSDKLNQGIIQQ